jgi:hypothetical protein
VLLLLLLLLLLLDWPLAGFWSPYCQILKTAR